MDKITFYFPSTKNKKYGYDVITDTYHCVECGKKVDWGHRGKIRCGGKNGKDQCNSKFMLRVDSK